MKKVLKINLVAVLALFIGFATMSFKVVTMDTAAAGWYSVDEDTGELSPIGAPDGVTCRTDYHTNVCAVYWPNETPAPATFEDLQNEIPNPQTAARQP